VLDVRLGQKLALEFVKNLLDLQFVKNLLKKNILDGQLVQKLFEQQMVYKSLYHLFSVLLQECVLDVRLGQKLALEFVQKFFDLHSVQNMLKKKWNAQLVQKLFDQQMG
jgi:hypothetical protein